MLYTVKSAVEGKDYFFREKQITSSSLTEITETEKSIWKLWMHSNSF